MKFFKVNEANYNIVVYTGLNFLTNDEGGQKLQSIYRDEPIMTLKTIGEPK